MSKKYKQALHKKVKLKELISFLKDTQILNNISTWGNEDLNYKIPFHTNLLSKTKYQVLVKMDNNRNI